MSLSAEQIAKNRDEFLALLRTVDRPGVESLIDWLNNSDFFTAPASTKYHCNFAGGLCLHSLNVAKVLFKLLDNFDYKEIPNQSATIVALLHDVSKANFYEETVRNEKVYSPQGTKRDNLGTYEWVSKTVYKVKETKDRFNFGSHSQESEYMLRYFIQLDLEESCAILHHMGPYDEETSQSASLSAIFSKHPLATLLHAADFIATHLLERDLE